MTNNFGDLKVYAIRNGREDFYKVDSPEEALILINNMADADLKNDAIDFNCFGLLIYTEDFSCDNDGWSEWHNEDWEEINDLLHKS